MAQRQFAALSRTHLQSVSGGTARRVFTLEAENRGLRGGELARDHGVSLSCFARRLPTPNPRPGAHATGLDGGKGAPPREASVHRIVSRRSKGA